MTPRHPDTDRLAALIAEHRDNQWPVQQSAIKDGGGWTYEAHLARFLAEAGLRLPAEPEAPDVRSQPVPTPCPHQSMGVRGWCRTCQPERYAKFDRPTPEPPAEPTVTLHTCWDNHDGPDGTHADGSPCRDKATPLVPASVPVAVTPDLRAAIPGLPSMLTFDAPTFGAFIAQRPDVWDIIRAALAEATSSPALDVERWIASLREDANGLCWVTKAELRQVFATSTDTPEAER